jgi:hypothetical protein
VNEVESLITEFKPPELVQPRNRTLDDPSCLAKSATVSGASCGKNGRNAHGTQDAAMGSGIVSTIALNARGTLPSKSKGSASP